MAPAAGFEPATKWLTATCATTALRRNGRESSCEACDANRLATKFRTVAHRPSDCQCPLRKNQSGKHAAHFPDRSQAGRHPLPVAPDQSVLS